eukprot:5625938-Pyramimonas_sp.AAC.1
MGIIVQSMQSLPLWPFATGHANTRHLPLRRLRPRRRGPPRRKGWGGFTSGGGGLTSGGGGFTSRDVVRAVTGVDPFSGGGHH